MNDLYDYRVRYALDLRTFAMLFHPMLRTNLMKKNMK